MPLFKVGSLLNFRMWFKYGLKVQKLLAQGVGGHDALLMPGACGAYMRNLSFFELLRFLMISKGSWVAFATCSVESPIASKRCAVSVLASCLPSTLPSSILLEKLLKKFYGCMQAHEEEYSSGSVS